MQQARSFGVVVLVVGIMAAFAWAAWPLPTAAATRADVFTVTVPVDATAASAEAAREKARREGERDAYTVLLDRLTLSRDRSRLPPPTDSLLNRVIQGFEVANEHHSTVRYLASYTYHFRPGVVEQLLQQYGVPFAETESKPVVVLAVLENPGGPVLWGDPNPWRDAWASAPPVQGLVPMTIPLGEIEDVAAIDAATADAGDDAHLQAISANYNHDDVLVTRATLHGSGDGMSIDVSTTRFIPGSPGGEQSWVASYATKPGESEQDLLARAVTGTVAQVEDAWKQANLLDYNQSATLVASVPANDLANWIAVRHLLAATPAVQSVDLISLDRRGARIMLHYLGSTDQLRVALAQNNLELTGGDPDWVLQQSSASSASAAPPSTPATVSTPSNP